MKLKRLKWKNTHLAHYRLIQLNEKVKAGESSENVRYLQTSLNWSFAHQCAVNEDDGEIASEFCWRNLSPVDQVSAANTSITLEYKAVQKPLLRDPYPLRSKISASENEYKKKLRPRSNESLEIRSRKRAASGKITNNSPAPKKSKSSTLQRASQDKITPSESTSHNSWEFHAFNNFLDNLEQSGQEYSFINVEELRKIIGGLESLCTESAEEMADSLKLTALFSSDFDLNEPVNLVEQKELLKRHLIKSARAKSN